MADTLAAALARTLPPGDALYRRQGASFGVRASRRVTGLLASHKKFRPAGVHAAVIAQQRHAQARDPSIPVAWMQVRPRSARCLRSTRTMSPWSIERRRRSSSSAMGWSLWVAIQRPSSAAALLGHRLDLSGRAPAVVDRGSPDDHGPSLRTGRASDRPTAQCTLQPRNRRSSTRGAARGARSNLGPTG
jgi:hypothetical protein